MATPTQCPLCGSGEPEQNVVTGRVYGGKPGQAFFKCSNCDVNYLYPGLSAEEEKQFYAAEFSNFMAGRAGASGGWDAPDKHIKANDWMVERRMKYIKPRLPQGGRALEVGCSSGFMLYPLQELGFECVGVEPAGVFGGYVRSRGITCFDSMEELMDSDVRKPGFDFIHHAFVLEHISKPEAFLQQQLDLLNPGGVLIFELPNAADALLTIYDIAPFERFYWMIAHTWYFTEKSLGHLLSRFGLEYEILLDQRYDLSNHMVWARDGRPGGMSRFTEKFGAELENQYRQALIKSGHCDTLIGVVRKSK